MKFLVVVAEEIENTAAQWLPAFAKRLGERNGRGRCRSGGRRAGGGSGDFRFEI
mgnify:CR=1 FL=1